MHARGGSGPRTTGDEQALGRFGEQDGCRGEDIVVPSIRRLPRGVYDCGDCRASTHGARTRCDDPYRTRESTPCTWAHAPSRWAIWPGRSDRTGRPAARGAHSPPTNGAESTVDRRQPRGARRTGSCYAGITSSGSSGSRTGTPPAADDLRSAQISSWSRRPCCAP